MEILLESVKKPEDINFIFGQSHFIKTVEDIHEMLVTSIPGVKFGLAFCEASGPQLVRWTGNDEGLIELATENALRIGAGHSFILFLGEGYFPINILPGLKQIREIVNIFCATSNPTQVVLLQTEQGRAVLGVVDGGSPSGIETEQDIAARKSFLRKIGYKF
ncbi:MAG: adenosine-specific kinase [Anaerolineaceae bacterium]|nr:adenosine-specific kinase [Anaerolineaceae bacterium]